MVIAFDIETTSLKPYDGIVTLIGMKNKGIITQWKIWEIGNESEMIINAIEEIVKSYETIVGYNNLKFDIPYMVERLRILGNWQPELYEVFNKKWLDLYQYLGNDYRSLTTWLKKAGIERDYPDLSGGDMPSYYDKLEYIKIEQHNIDDLNTSEKLYKFLREKNPELLPKI